jgi:hypothetical protein
LGNYFSFFLFFKRINSVLSKLCILFKPMHFIHANVLSIHVFCPNHAFYPNTSNPLPHGVRCASAHSQSGVIRGSAPACNSYQMAKNAHHGRVQVGRCYPNEVPCLKSTLNRVFCGVVVRSIPIKRVPRSQ